MQLSDILKAIQPCNMELPYIFVSYSAKDQARVWQDVLQFQQMGYNVWLDEKNLDKTQASWRSDALNAIRDMNCSLLVFYVSRHSLVSQPCYSELSCTVEEYTRAVHFGPVKFVAVDAEPISDIMEFSREVYTQIRKKDIPKAEKTSQAVTLHNCIEQFFNSNNEKVRVSTFTIPNRKMDYYEEITATFPEDTRVLEPVHIPNSKPEPTIIPKPVPVVTPVKQKPEAGAKTKQESMPHSDHKLKEFMLAEKAMAAGTKELYSYQSFTPAYALSQEQLENAVANIAKGEKKENILGMFDEGKQYSFRRPGEYGVVLTKTTLYCSLAKQNPVDLKTLRMVRMGKEHRHLELFYADGRKEDVCFEHHYQVVKAVLEVYAEANRQQ